jgi:hypothetical protein
MAEEPEKGSRRENFGFMILDRPSPLRSNYLKKFRGFSPQANYTDRATAACRRS